MLFFSILVFCLSKKTNLRIPKILKKKQRIPTENLVYFSPPCGRGFAEVRYCYEQDKCNLVATICNREEICKNVCVYVGN